MVSSPESQRSYLKTIRAEADRLGHLVENVLSFARLERGRAVDGPRGHRAADMLLERLVPRLELRARQAGMELIVLPVDSRPNVCVDISVVEQILTNLVDNAIKYAGGRRRSAHSSGRRCGRAMACAFDSRPRTGTGPAGWSAGCSARFPSRPTTRRSQRPESVWGSPFAADSPDRWGETCGSRRTAQTGPRSR